MVSCLFICLLFGFQYNVVRWFQRWSKSERENFDFWSVEDIIILFGLFYLVCVFVFFVFNFGAAQIICDVVGGLWLSACLFLYEHKEKK